MDFVEKQIDRIVISGMNVRTSNKKEENPETAQIPDLWRRFYADELPKVIPNQTPNFAVYGVYSEFDRGPGGDYTVTVGLEIRNDLRENMAFPVVVVEPGRYLTFAAKAAQTDSVLNTWRKIWDFFLDSTEYKRAYTTDFDYYKTHDEVVVHVSILD